MSARRVNPDGSLEVMKTSKEPSSVPSVPTPTSWGSQDYPGAQSVMWVSGGQLPGEQYPHQRPSTIRLSDMGLMNPGQGRVPQGGVLGIMQDREGGDAARDAAIQRGLGDAGSTDPSQVYAGWTGQAAGYTPGVGTSSDPNDFYAGQQVSVFDDQVRGLVSNVDDYLSAWTVYRDTVLRAQDDSVGAAFWNAQLARHAAMKSKAENSWKAPAYVVGGALTSAAGVVAAPFTGGLSYAAVPAGAYMISKGMGDAPQHVTFRTRLTGHIDTDSPRLMGYLTEACARGLGCCP